MWEMPTGDEAHVKVETVTDRNDVHDRWLTCFKRNRAVRGAGAVI